MNFLFPVITVRVFCAIAHLKMLFSVLDHHERMV